MRRPDESECPEQPDERADRILGDGPEDHARVPVLMDTLPPKPTSSRSGSRIPLSPAGAVLLAIMFGLCGGYLDLFLMLFRNLWWVDDGSSEIGRDFPWTVPVAHAVLMLIPGVLIAAACRLRPGLISLRAASWLFATLAIWAALLEDASVRRTCHLLLAAGLGRPIGAAVDIHGRSRRTVRYVLAGLVGVLGVLAALSSGRQALQEAPRAGRIAAAAAAVPATSC